MLRKWMLICLTGPGLHLLAAESDSDRLYSAMRAGDIVRLKTLLDHGVSPNSLGDHQVTPLMYAAAVGSAETMRVLIARGADVNAQNDFGSTPLMWSATDLQKVRLLLDHGADVNQTAKSGRTALLLAARAHPSAEIVRLLLAKGADRTVKDRQGVTPLFAAAQSGDLATIRMLVESGADVNAATTPIGLTPLMAAAATRNLAAARLLLSKGANVNAVSSRENLPKVKNGTVLGGGFTPLILASTSGNPELVKVLLAAGANVNAADVRGMTPLMLASTTDRLNPEILKVLLANGADIHVRSLAGETALDWARKYGRKDAVEFLGGKWSQPEPTAAATASRPDLRTAVERSVALLEKTSGEFFAKGGCYGCHAQGPAHFAAAAAGAKGISIDEEAAKERIRQISARTYLPGPLVMERQTATGGPLYALEALARSGYTPDRNTDFQAAEVAAEQDEDGGWHRAGLARTPLQDGDFSQTAMAIRVLKVFGTPGRASENKERIERGKQWLLRAKPVVTEDLDMRLTGVALAGASQSELRKLAEPILQCQRTDGGWAQSDQLATDAYATGMTLSALAEAGVVQPDNPIYQRGVKFLLSTQSSDGSWHVVSRAAGIQPYFESGFPYGHDQWISMMGTGWAANALARAVTSN